MSGTHVAFCKFWNRVMQSLTHYLIRSHSHVLLRDTTHVQSRYLTVQSTLQTSDLHSQLVYLG